MRLKRYFSGEIVTLTAKIGGGGEGRIYAVANTDLVAKIYHSPDAEIAGKLSAMIARPPVDPGATDGHVSIAWPVDLLCNATGKVVGFLMPRVEKVRPIHDYYTPTTRRDLALRFNCLFNYLYLHRTAQNLAIAVRSLHDRGYIIGDVNESNILVSQTALVTLVDTDSFQVKDGDRLYACPVGKPEFTPPELQGQSFRTLKRNPDHDRFGLAIVIFQLLMEGTHPFAGVYLEKGEPSPIASRIRSGYFPYGKRRVPYRPTPIAPPFHILNPRLQELFVRCFEEGYLNPKLRPSANSWVQALDAAESALVICDRNRRHRYGDHLDRCPWCDRARAFLGRDPFPSREEARRQKFNPKPKVRSKDTSRAPAYSTRSSSYLPSLSPSLTIVGTNAHGFWRQLANCKMDLFLGSLVLMLSVGAAFYLNGRPMRSSPPTVSEQVTTPPVAKPVVPLWDKQSHNGEVVALAIAPDGSQLVSAGKDGKLKVWQLTEGTLVKEFAVEDVQKLAFTKHGSAIVVATANAIQIWDAETGELHQQKPHPLQQIAAISRNARGQLLLAGELDGKMTVWNEETETAIATFPAASEGAIALSEDGKTLATVTDKLRLWNVETGNLDRVLDIDRFGNIDLVALLNDKETLIVGDGEDRLELWNTTTDRLWYADSENGAFAVAYVGNYLFLTGSRSGHIQLWMNPTID